MVRKGLGRGLSTLLGEKQASAGPSRAPIEEQLERELPSAGVLLVHLESIEPNPYQPRTEMDEEALNELAGSIKTHGLLEPLLVRTHPARPHTYQLIAGERRMRASQRAGLAQVPVLVRKSTEAEMLEIAIVENVQRENLNPIEEGRAYQQLMEGGPGMPSLTQLEVSERVGKSRATIANLLRLLDLPPFVQESILKGELSQGHGKILVGLDEERARQAWEYACRETASVRALEQFLKKLETSGPEGFLPRPARKSAAEPAAVDPNITAIQEALQERLRTKVSVRFHKGGAGVVEAHFFNSEDLDRLLESLDIEL